MNYTELVESIVDELLDESLVKGEKPSDRGKPYRKSVATHIKNARDIGNLEHGGLEGVHHLGSLAGDYFIDSQNEKEYPAKTRHMQLMAAKHFAKARENEVNRLFNRDKAGLKRELGGSKG